MHGARVIALEGNFGQALEIVAIAQRHPVSWSARSAQWIEGQKTAAFEVIES
jgi:threonine synthase